LFVNINFSESSLGNVIEETFGELYNVSRMIVIKVYIKFGNIISAYCWTWVFKYFILCYFEL